MSVLELNGRVFDASTTGTLTLTGEGSATTNVTQGLAKCWVNFNGIGTIAARDSFNLSSLTDTGTGDHTVVVTNNMANDDIVGYGFSSSGAVTGTDTFINPYVWTTTGVAMGVNNSSGNLIDRLHINVALLGDLA